MIKTVNAEINGIAFDTMLELSDWRYSASALGIVRFLKNVGGSYEISKKAGESCIVVDENGEIKEDLTQSNIDDALFYNKESIIYKNVREKYLDFVEVYFRDYMHHIKIIKRLKSDEYQNIVLEETDKKKKEELKGKIKIINDLMTANSILKKSFKKIKYDGTNNDEIINIIEENRYLIIEETYKNGLSCYRKYGNENLFGKDPIKLCRLHGYYVDTGRKTKSISYNWDFNTNVAKDEYEFDYIPFAFTTYRDSYFINNNFTVKSLIDANDLINEMENYDETNTNRFKTYNLFLSKSNDYKYIDYEVEIIRKSIDLDFYESILIRDDSLRIFDKINESGSYDYIVKSLNNSCKVGKETYIDIDDIAISNIINMTHLDYIIDLLLKDETNPRNSNNHGFLLSQLIKINELICKRGGNQVEDKQKALDSARVVGFALANRLEKNKVISYRNKLISCLTFKDYDRFCTVLLQLSSYANNAKIINKENDKKTEDNKKISGTINMNFAYKLFEDFEENKNIAYTFVNAFNVNDYKKESK